MARNRLYVGNLPYKACTETALRELFKPRSIVEIKIVNDRETRRPRGFCFVEFAADVDVNEVISRFNGALIDKRQIVVSEAREPKRSDAPTNEGDRRQNRRHDAGNGGQRERSDDDYADTWRRQ